MRPVFWPLLVEAIGEVSELPFLVGIKADPIAQRLQVTLATDNERLNHCIEFLFVGSGLASAGGSPSTRQECGEFSVPKVGIIAFPLTFSGWATLVSHAAAA